MSPKPRSAPLLDPSSMDGTSLLLKLDSLLVRSGETWTAMLPLRGVIDPRASPGALAQDAALLDLKNESNALYRTYRQEALILALLGSVAIVACSPSAFGRSVR